MVRLISRVLRPQWRKAGTVKPGPELSVTENGEVWQFPPRGAAMPAIVRLVIFRVTLAVLVIVFVLRLTVPVAGPFWIISVVATTGMMPNSFTDAVAGGRVSVDEDAPVVRSTVEARVPEPRFTVVLSFLMNVVPVSA